MKKKLLMLTGGLLAVAMLFGAWGVNAAHAQDGTPPARQPGDGPGHGGRGMSQAELEAAAEALGMTTDELSTSLQNGQTLEELAAAAGVDIADVQAAIQAAHREEMRACIEAGVADGTISQEKADWLLEGLDKGFLDGPGLGFGFGRGGHHDGHGAQPTQTTDQ